ncbi:MAG: hypothetical protein AAE977_06915 [Thermoplasmataceae archaeon]
MVYHYHYNENHSTGSRLLSKWRAIINQTACDILPSLKDRIFLLL